MNKFVCYFLNILIVLYAIADFMSSASAGNANTQRGTVYAALISIILIMMLKILPSHSIKINSFSKYLSIFVLYYFFNKFVLSWNVEWFHAVYLGLCIWWILTIRFFRDMQDKEPSTYRLYSKFCLFMFFFYVFVVLYGAVNIVARFSSIQFARVGYAYHLLSILPMILLNQDRKSKLLFISIGMVAVVISLKRGAIIAFPIVLFVYFYVENLTGHAHNNIRKILLAMLVFFVVCVIFDNYSEGFLSSRFEMEEISEGSGRAEGTMDTLRNISKRDLLQLTFGIKARSEESLGGGAHNEYLNRLESVGIVGFLLYLTLMFSLIRTSVVLIHKKSILAASFSAMTIYSIGIGLVSGWLFMHSTFYIMMYIGFVTSLATKEENEIKNILVKEVC